MQENIKKRVEDYLDGRLPEEDLKSLLEQYPSDGKTLQEFFQQSEMIRSLLRTPAELAPAPGFYARVMNQVEKEKGRQSSIWSLFTDPFGQRLVYASMVLLALMGITLFTSDPEDLQNFALAPASILVDHTPEVHLVGDEMEDRSRVFVTLTSTPDIAIDPDDYQ